MNAMNLSFLLLLSASPCLAAGLAEGPRSGGGGDTCEDRIQVVRDDLTSWIQNGGPKGLTLPSGVSVDRYSQAMLQQISAAKVVCVGQGDPGFPVNINGTPKVCVFTSDVSGSRITCDFKKFLDMPPFDQYVLVHHEYAGLAGLEQPDADESHYAISNQITDFLEIVDAARLSVAKLPEPKTLDLVSNFRAFVGKYAVVRCTDEIVQGTAPPQLKDCGPYTRAEMFFGDDYQPKEGGHGLYLTLYRSDTDKKGWTSAGIAYSDSDLGDVGSMLPGAYFLDSRKNGYIMSTTVRSVGGQTFVDWVLSWPAAQEHYMYHKMSAVLAPL